MGIGGVFPRAPSHKNKLSGHLKLHVGPAWLHAGPRKLSGWKLVSGPKDVLYMIFFVPKADPVNFPRVIHSVGSCHPTNIVPFQRARASVGAAPSAIAPRHQRICVELDESHHLEISKSFFRSIYVWKYPLVDLGFLFFSCN